MTTVVMGGISYLTTFGPTDYWKSIGGGKCGSYSGYYDRSAVTEIPRKANYVVPYPANGYITDVEAEEFNPAIFPEYQEYCFYQSGDNNIIPYEQACLSPSELNYWLNKIKQLAIDYKPVDKETAGYGMIWTGYNIPDGPYYYTHIPVISYGIFHYDGQADL
jgi:hypothetical protein